MCWFSYFQEQEASLRRSCLSHPLLDYCSMLYMRLLQYALHEVDCNHHVVQIVTSCRRYYHDSRHYNYPACSSAHSSGCFMSFPSYIAVAQAAWLPVPSRCKPHLFHGCPCPFCNSLYSESSYPFNFVGGFWKPAFLPKHWAKLEMSSANVELVGYCGAVIVNMMSFGRKLHFLFFWTIGLNCLELSCIK